jgi:hypothetical protein
VVATLANTGGCGYLSGEKYEVECKHWYLQVFERNKHWHMQLFERRGR